MGTFHKVAEAKDLAPGKGMAIEVAGNKIALFNVDGTATRSQKPARTVEAHF